MGKIKRVACDDDKGIAGKTGAPAGKISKGVSQPVTGKLKGMQSMPGGGDASKGGPIRTVPSNPVYGAGKSSGTAMGSGDVIPGMV